MDKAPSEWQLWFGQGTFGAEGPKNARILWVDGASPAWYRLKHRNPNVEIDEATWQLLIAKYIIVREKIDLTKAVKITAASAIDDALFTGTAGDLIDIYRKYRAEHAAEFIIIESDRIESGAIDAAYVNDTVLSMVPTPQESSNYQVRMVINENNLALDLDNPRILPFVKRLYSGTYAMFDEDTPQISFIMYKQRMELQPISEFDVDGRFHMESDLGVYETV